ARSGATNSLSLHCKRSLIFTSIKETAKSRYSRSCKFQRTNCAFELRQFAITCLKSAQDCKSDAVAVPPKLAAELCQSRICRRSKCTSVQKFNNGPILLHAGANDAPPSPTTSGPPD